MSDIFREVDEEVRKDKAAAVWKKYGIYVAIVCLAIIIGTGGRVFWREYQEGKRLDESRQYFAATLLAESGRIKEAISEFSHLNDKGDTGYGILAAFSEAKALGSSGDHAAAVTVLDDLSEDGSVAVEFRELAKLYAVMWLIDDAPLPVVEERLGALTKDNSIWRHSALELSANLMMRERDYNGARKIYHLLIEEEGVPEPLRIRSKAVVAAMAGK